jgi:S1-C subfamily serine protease
MQGQVIGLLDAGDEGTQCCSYAIPSNTISQIVPSLIETRTYDHPYHGIHVVTLNADATAREKIPRNIQGVFVNTIERNSPAERAGVKGTSTNQFGEETPIGDVITAIDGHPIATIDDFDAYIDSHKHVGDIAHFTIYRNGKTLDVPITFEK